MVLITSWLVGAAALDAYGRRDPPEAGWDALVVLGCRVMPSGEPSLTLARRTRHAVDLWRSGVAPRIVLTGGVGDGPVSEGRAAADLARSLGVPDEALVVEARSTSTEENLRFAAELLEPGARVVVVTDAYHVFRAERVARRYFPRAMGAGSVGHPYYRAKGAIREVFAVLAYGTLGRLR